MKAFAPFSNDPDKVSDNDYDYAFGAGARAGLTIGYFPYTTLGFSYQTRIDMSAFDKYAGLFAEQGDFDIPANWNAGAAFQLPWRQTLLFDYQKVDYDAVAAVGNPMDPNRFVNQCALPRIGGSTADSDACLGANTGPGFGWRDVTTRKLGWQLELGALTLRAGYSKNDQPIGASEVLFNILAPAVPEEHYTTGFAYPLGSAWAVGMSVMVAKNNPVTGKNPLSNAEASEAQLLAELAAPGSGNTQQAFGSDPEDQDLTLSMRQYEVMFGLSYRFR
jgi:long-chain fatty acid transport protein